MVLVHGAFADGSGWEAVADILKEDGYKVSVAQPPETSYADDQKYTKAAIDAMDGPVVLVGHSYGGSIITEAGNHPNVTALVYIAAFALDEGESCASIEQALPQASKAFKPDSDGNWWIDQEHFAADFAADIPKEKAEFMAISQVPISTDAFTHKVTNPAWKTKPTWYMVATADRSINPDQERMMAKRANAKTVEVNASHVAYMSHPKETAKLIEEAAASAQSVKPLTIRLLSAQSETPLIRRPRIGAPTSFLEITLEESTMKNRITIESRDGAFRAYIARPKVLPAPAVVVLHEVFGVNADIRKTCDELAEQGFIAVAPDLFWRQEPGVDLSVTSEPDWQHGLRLYQAYDRDAGARDVKDTANAVAKLPECTGKVAVLGYCLGGLMTFLTAVRYGVDAAVAYHGGDTEKYLGEVDGLHAPLLMHLAEEDEFISKPAQAEIKTALAGKPNATVYSYPGQNHAFARHNGAHYNAAAAALANGRTSEFLHQQLR